MAEKMDLLLEAARLGGRVDLITREELLRDLLSRWTLELADDARKLDGWRISWAAWLERKAEEIKNGK